MGWGGMVSTFSSLLFLLFSSFVIYLGARIGLPRACRAHEPEIWKDLASLGMDAGVVEDLGMVDVVTRIFGAPKLVVPLMKMNMGEGRGERGEGRGERGEGRGERGEGRGERGEGRGERGEGRGERGEGRGERGEGRGEGQYVI